MKLDQLTKNTTSAVSAATVSAALCISPTGSYAYSDAAKFIGTQVDNVKCHLSQSLSSGVEASHSALYAVYQDCKSAGWDGYQARPVSEASYHKALRLLMSLPMGFPMPEISADPDGYINFEWYESPARVLSVNVSSEDMLYYAALLSGNRKSGAMRCFDGMPPEIIEIVNTLALS